MSPLHVLDKILSRQEIHITPSNRTIFLELRSHGVIISAVVFFDVLGKFFGRGINCVAAHAAVLSAGEFVVMAVDVGSVKWRFSFGAW